MSVTKNGVEPGLGTGLAGSVKPDEKVSWKFYLAGALLLFLTKYYYSRAEVGALDWILAPTARWAGFLGGITFQYDPDLGYVSHHFRFIIARSCSGVQFMIVVFAALLFSFLHRMTTEKRRYQWFLISAVIAFSSTVFINGIRIVLAVYLPFVYSGRLSPERLHSMIGIVTYLIGLMVLYRTVDHITARSNITARARLYQYLVPVLWYAFIVLFVPLLNGAYRNDGFTEYAMMILAVCLCLAAIYAIFTLIAKRQ